MCLEAARSSCIDPRAAVALTAVLETHPQGSHVDPPGTGLDHFSDCSFFTMTHRTLWTLSLALYILALSETFMIPNNLDSGTCPLGQFPCGNLSVCLPQPLHCNGNKDCENGADEENCVDNSGWPALFDAIQRDRASRGRPEEDTDECVLNLVPESCNCWRRYINCTGQDLRAVPAVSSNVTALFLQNNKIRNLSQHAFAGLFDLKRLFLSHNQITLVESGVFKDLRQLEWLIFDNNRLSKIVPGSFMGLESLFLLVLLNNSIRDIPAKVLCTEMPRLNWLDLEGNQMRMIRGSVFEQCITVLVLRRNKIKKIQPGALSTMRNLVELDLSVNKLQELPPSLLKDLPVLQQLNISFNPLKEITKDHFDALKQLHSLGLEGLEIPNIHNQMFTKLTNLSHIYFKKFQYCSYAPHVRACKPNTDGISSFEDLLANILLRVFVWVMACITCFGNLFVICMRSFIVTENCQHTMSIKSLCCADCLMGVYLFSIGAFDLKFQGEYNKHAHAWKESSECKFVGSLAMLSSEVSVMLLTYMTLEKYLCIVFPFSHFRASRKQTLSMLLAIWLLGLLITVIPFWSESAFGNFYGRNGVCFPLQSDEEEKPGARDYSASIFLGLNLIAFVTIVFSYTSMFYSIHQTGAKTAERSVLSREVAIAKRFFFIVFTDALCWIPIFLLKAVSLTKVEIPTTITSWVVIFILPINSALNPILYTVTTASFQERLKQCLKIKQRQLQESFTLVSTQITNTA